MDKMVFFGHFAAARRLLRELWDVSISLRMETSGLGGLIIFCHSLAGTLLIELKPVVLSKSIELVEILVKVHVQGWEALSAFLAAYRSGH